MDTQLTLFPGLVTPAQPAVEPEPPPVVLEGQLHLFEGEAAQLTQIASLLDDGRFSEAMARLDGLQGARFSDVAAWRLRVRQVAEAVESAGPAAERLAAIAAEWDEVPSRGVLPHSMFWAIRRGLHHLTARTAEASGAGAIVGVRPAGWHWMKASKLSEARRSFQASVERGLLPGISLVWLGNLAWRDGAMAEARAYYCEALLRDPTGVPLADVQDDATRDLVDQAREMNLTPPEAWAPLVGFASDHFAALTRPSIVATVAQYQATLARSRDVTKRGGADARLRKDLKSSAPQLFERLMSAGRV